MTTLTPKEGFVYYLKDFTAPKVFKGMYFECLVTDQRISRKTRIKKETNVHVQDWPHEIYQPERFKKLKIN